MSTLDDRWADIHPVELVVAEAFTIRFSALRFRAVDVLDVALRESTALLLGAQDVMQLLKVTLDGDTTTLESREPGVTEWDMPNEVLEPAA
jgi:hypothetical protein